MHPIPQLLILWLFTACNSHPDQVLSSYSTIAAIPPPAGYTRVQAASGSFGEWLRQVQLKKENHVHLYNGQLKNDQSVQFAVLDISVGKKDLQQCADAVMRLRAEYLYAQGRYNEIEFRDNDNKAYKWTGGNDRLGFESYLEKVFSWCGSASLSKQLRSVALNDIQQGDVLIKGGFPGHAMLVMDVAVNSEGKKVYMLSQSYMPAQDIHVVKNPGKNDNDCWYEVNGGNAIITPEWVFYSNQLKRW